MAKSERVRALTVVGVERLKPPKRGRVEFWDAALPGFGLRVSAKGTKTWFVMGRKVDGTQVRPTLGRYPVMGLLEAREAARDVLRSLPAGGDPTAEKRRKRAEDQHSRIDTGWPAGSFGALAEKYIERKCIEMVRGREIESVIRRELLPEWGNRLLEDLRKRDAYLLLDALVKAGKPAAANRLHETIRAIANWGVKRDLIEFSPFSVMETPARRVERRRLLNDDEIRALWSA